MGLKRYQEKRNFARTPEPKGREHSRSGGSSFVVQKHAASRLHYDFRLELDGVLKSWAVPKGPSLHPEEKRLAVEVEDHPLEYGDFEGIIPEGEYGGGTVLLWDRGTWHPEGDPRKGYETGRLRFRLEGEKLHGTWSLVRMGRNNKNWLLIKSHDDNARPPEEEDITEEKTESVSSGRSLDEISRQSDRVWETPGKKDGKTARPGKSRTRKASAPSPVPELGTLKGARKAPMPREVEAQLATLVKEAPHGGRWFHEVKFDGYRILAFLGKGRVRLVTRNGKDWTERFAEVARLLEKLPVREAVLDGEVVALDQRGRSDFQTLQNTLTAGGKDLLYYAFDLLHLDGTDLRGVACEERAALLEQLLSEAPERLRFSTHFDEEDGSLVLQKACDLGMEGIISKRRDAPYRGGRGENWVKTKCVRRQEFVIGGWTDPAGSRTELGALLVGVHDAKGKLLYAGQVGTGFTRKSLRDLGEKLRALETAKSPFAAPPTGREAAGVHWVRPELVAEVEFTEWTRDRRLRHPSFQGLREDKSSGEVIAEVEKSGPRHDGSKKRGSSKAAPAAPSTRKAAKKTGKPASGDLEVVGVRISSPGKVLYPQAEFTKEDIARHYERVADRLLSHAGRRPLMVVRCPGGIGSKCFVQRRSGRGIPAAVGKIPVRDKGKMEHHLAVADSAGLAGLAQVGALEVHAWGCWPDDPEMPDRLTFDLDPGPGTSWADLVKAAREIRSRLEKLGLIPFVKTSGGRGLHVVVPLSRGADWEQAESFARELARKMASEAPDQYVSTMAKAKRKERIFIDYLRNARAASVVAPWSPRARPGGTVSMPVTWEELSRAAPEKFTLATAPARLKKKDPWAAFDSSRRKLP